MAKKIVISFTSVFTSPKKKRARRAMKRVKDSIAKSFHVEPGSILVSKKINETIFKRGFEKIPRRIQIMVQRDGGKVKAFLAGEKIPLKKKEKKKHEKKEQVEEETRKEIERKKKEKRAMEVAAEKTAIKLKSDKG